MILHLESKYTEQRIYRAWYLVYWYDISSESYDSLSSQHPAVKYMIFIRLTSLTSFQFPVGIFNMTFRINIIY